MPASHLALLRGINLGGANKLPMKELAALFAEAGCADVRTYIQSGNVVFSIAAGKAAKLPDQLTKRIADRFGLKVPVVLRTAAQMRDVVANNPFPTDGVDEKTLHVMFLADRPSADRVDALDPDRSPPDAFAVRGAEIYLSLPNGAARSKLTTAYFDTKLGTVSTARNWRTVTMLLAMMAE